MNFLMKTLAILLLTTLVLASPMEEKPQNPPNIDRLAQEGILFTDAHSGALGMLDLYSDALRADDRALLLSNLVEIQRAHHQRAALDRRGPSARGFLSEENQGRRKPRYPSNESRTLRDGRPAPP